MGTMVFANFPVADIEKSAQFYEALGFTRNEDYSNDDAIGLMWDDNFWVMVLTHEFYGKFIKDKKIANAHTTSTALVAFSVESADAVKKFAEAAKQNGGDYYHIDMGIPEDQMYALEVVDLDGNVLEACWMTFE